MNQENKAHAKIRNIAQSASQLYSVKTVYLDPINILNSSSSFITIIPSIWGIPDALEAFHTSDL
jgi:hypothetical protein